MLQKEYPCHPHLLDPFFDDHYLVGGSIDDYHFSGHYHAAGLAVVGSWT